MMFADFTCGLVYMLGSSDSLVVGFGGALFLACIFALR